MNVSDLTTIIKTVDRKAVTDGLKRLLSYLHEHSKLVKVGIVTFVRAVKYETEDFADSDGSTFQRAYMLNS